MAQGVVKFFNSAKGFGFVAPDDGGPDAFVHVSAVQAAGLVGLDEGDVLRFELQQDRRSGRVSAADLELVEKAPARAFTPRSAPVRFDRAAPREAVGSGEGMVKWFNATKGFGFIQPLSGGDDIFVHARSVQRSGLFELKEGQTVRYDLERDDRTGKVSAVRITLAGS